MRSLAVRLALMSVMSFVAVGCSRSDAQPSRQELAHKTDSITDVVVDGEPKTRCIMMMGDIMLGTQHPFNDTGAYLPYNDGANLFDSVTPILSRGDFVVGNLEGVFLDRSEEADKSLNDFSAFNFMMPTRYAALLKEAGFTALAITNNHANDFHQMGVRSTCETLRGVGIPYSGVKAEGGYTIVEREGVRYALCAFSTSPGGNHMDNISAARDIIKEAADTAHVVVVSFHGGAEGVSACHVPRQKEWFKQVRSRGDVFKFSRACVDAGADVVFGHGPHVARAVEIYRGHLIAYSLGNFCTPTGINISGKLGYAPLLEVEVDTAGLFVRGKIHSFKQRKRNGPCPDPHHTVACEINTLSISDFPDTHPTITPTGIITP